MIVSLRSYLNNHIDVMIQDDKIDKSWHFMGFYGSSFANERSDSLDILRRLGDNYELPWIVCGDFNEILYSIWKRGLLRDERRMKAFREVLDECWLTDIGFSGPWFTWERENLLETNIRERLDRGVANE